MAFDFYWDKDTSVDTATEEYLTICTADLLKSVYKNITEAKKSDLNFQYMDTSGAYTENLTPEEAEDLGYAPYKPNRPFISGIGYDPKEKVYVDTTMQDYTYPYPYPDTYPNSDPSIVEAVQKEMDSMYRTEYLGRGMILMGGTGGDVFMDGDDNVIVRAGAVHSIYKAAKYGENQVHKAANNRRFRTKTRNSLGDTEPTLYRIHNDWYGDIICELIGENDKAYYFQFKEGDKVILPSMRILKGSPRILERISGWNATGEVAYYPGKTIDTESGQQFSVKEMKDVLHFIQSYLNGDYNTAYMEPVHIAVNYGNGKIYSSTDGIEDPHYSNTSFRPRGAKGAYFLYGEDQGGDIAGNAYICLPDGTTPYSDAKDTPETEWTVDFRS